MHRCSVDLVSPPVSPRPFEAVTPFDVESVVSDPSPTSSRHVLALLVGKISELVIAVNDVATRRCSDCVRGNEIGEIRAQVKKQGDAIREIEINMTRILTGLAVIVFVGQLVATVLSKLFWR